MVRWGRSRWETLKLGYVVGFLRSKARARRSLSKIWRDAELPESPGPILEEATSLERAANVLSQEAGLWE